MLLPLLAVLIWSANTVASKAAAAVFDPAAISLYRWLLAAIVLTPMFARPLWRARAQLLRHLPQLAVLSLLGMVASQCLAYYAAHLTTATNMGVITALIPLSGLLIGAAFFRQSISSQAVAGVVLSLGGVAYLMGAGNPLFLLQHGANAGDAMVLLGSTAYALYGILYRRWAPPLGQWLNLYAQVLLAVLMLLPLASTASSLAIPLAGLPVLLVAGIGSSIVAAYLWMLSIQRIGSERTAIFMNLLPLFTALLASATLGETIHAYHWIGGGLILAGVSLSQRRPASLRAAQAA
ncbi:DMT family transporter [Vogesella sp. LIG4]|uniref:DMT family transporter n=1 Tax=Vogesella sp. LIG4 TaxID=1192162 RepID=UPI001E6192A3|nr:DMT family transporter [Vogesella sp. LIG4]